MMNPRTKHFGYFLAWFLTVRAASALVILNGSFETPGFTDPSDRFQIDNGSTVIDGWTFSIFSTPADWLKSPTYSVDDGLYAVRVNQNDNMTTVLNTTAGQLYHVNIRAAGDTVTGFFHVSAGNNSETFQVFANSPYTSYAFDFTADPSGGGLDPLVISGNGASGRPTIDNVSVTLLPEPNTAVLTGLALALGLTSRRRLCRTLPR